MLQHHSWTEQLPHTVFVASPKQKKSLEIQGVKYQFVTLSEKKFFGDEEISINGLSVKVSDREKTLLDCLDHLKYAGGITEVSKALWNAKDELDWEKLLSYGIRMGDSAILKRLGYLTELLRLVDSSYREKIETHLKKGYSLLDLSAGRREGQRLSRWRLILNISPDQFLSWKTESSKREGYPTRPWEEQKEQRARVEISDFLKAKRKEILRLCAKRGARKVRVFKQPKW